MQALLLFGTGLALLVYAAELIVRHGVALALALGVKPIVIGLTFVAVGTSAPELAVGTIAALGGNGALAVGNIAGTNVVNLLLILGLSALLRPLPLHRRTVRTDLPVLVAATAAMTLLAWDGKLSRLDGGLLLGAAAGYTLLIIRHSRGEARAVKAEYTEMYGGDGARVGRAETAGWQLNAVYLAAGIALSILGGHWLVAGAVELARAWGLSEAVIGLTIVAIGTSAPELVTSIVGTLRNERDVVVGNLLGSCVYNILFILGLTCTLPANGIAVAREFLAFDIPFTAAVALLCVPVFVTGRKVSSMEGGLFLVLYGAYLCYLLVPL